MQGEQSGCTTSVEVTADSVTQFLLAKELVARLRLLLLPGEHIGEPDGEIECTERLGGLLRYYHRAAA